MDDRDLQGEAGSGGSRPDPGHAGNAGGAGSPTIGDAGAPGTGGAETDGGTAGAGSTSAGRAGASYAGRGGGSGDCPDLDGNQVPDCEETVVENSAFDANTQPWIEETGLVTAWDEADALGSAGSGSLLVENRNESDRDGSSMGGARQCIPVEGGRIYQIGAHLLVPEDQSEGTGGLQLVFHDDAACTGGVVDAVTSNLVGAGSSWRIVVSTQRAPTTARSASLRLVAIKAFRQPAFKAYFDNVLLRGE